MDAEHERDGGEAMEVEAKPSAEADVPGAAAMPDGSAVSGSAGGAGGAGGAVEGAASPPLFDEFYDDWEAFDQAVSCAVAKHHPIRKRSSLTFDVYNRTVSKGTWGSRSEWSAVADGRG
jgi:hypothetical protein